MHNVMPWDGCVTRQNTGGESVPGVSERGNQEDIAAQVAYARRAWQRLGLRVRTITPRGCARLLLIVGAAWCLGWLISRSWAVLTPFVVGLALAYLLLPQVDLLNRWLPRWLAILVVYVVMTLLLTAGWAFIVPPLVSQISSLVQALPSGIEVRSLVASLERVWRSLDPVIQRQLGGVAEGVFQTLRDNFLIWLRGLLDFVVGGLFTVYNVLSFVLGLVVVPFFIYYVLNDYEKLMPALNRVLPSWMQADFWAVVQIVDHTISRYLRGQLVLVLIGAVATFLGLTMLLVVGFQGVDYVLLLSIVSGLTVLIPYVGFVLAVLAAFGVGAFSSWQTALAMAVVVLIVKQVVDTLIYPIVVGRSVHLHQAVVLLALVALSEFGFVWVILAPSIAAAVRDLFLYVYGRFDDPPRPAGQLPGAPVPQGSGKQSR